MAKFNSVLTVTGKIGEIVGMKGDNGETYTRKMVTPANPNTDAQIQVRNIMSLAGQLSKLTPASLIYGLNGDNKRQRRARFTQLIAQKATSELQQDGTIHAALAPADLTFSEGTKRELNDITATMSQSGEITVAKTGNFDEDLAAVIAIAAYSETINGPYTAIEAATLTSTNTSHLFRARRSAQANIYYMPVFRSESASGVRYQIAVNNIQATDSYTTQANIMTSGLFNYGASQYHSTVTPGA